MKARLGHCLLLLLLAEMTTPTVRSSRGRKKTDSSFAGLTRDRGKCRPPQSLPFGPKMPLLPRLPRPRPSE
jgi:hypothetical protein